MHLPATRPLMRAALTSRSANGFNHFTPQCQKLVFEFCENWPTSAGTRTYLQTRAEHLARENPHVEVEVRVRNNKEPIVRGLYLNGRDKVISLKSMHHTLVEQKVQLLLDSSGAKIKPLKKTVESTTEAARGIWSGMHIHEPYKI